MLTRAILILIPKQKYSNYQLKKLSDYAFTVSQLLVGSAVVNLFDSKTETMIDIKRVPMLLFSLAAALVFYRMGITQAGKVKDK